jgi:hypothetical protein
MNRSCHLQMLGHQPQASPKAASASQVTPKRKRVISDDNDDDKVVLSPRLELKSAQENCDDPSESQLCHHV